MQQTFALGECRVEPARPEKQLYQSRTRFRGRRRIGGVDHYSDLAPGAAQPCRYGQKLGFLVVGALRWCIRTIEERGQPKRAETDVDPEADEAGEVGPANTFPLGECNKGDAFALGECRVEPARPEKRPRR